METERITHTLDPIFDARSRVLILGTMPSPKSRALGFYYANPQNRFWRVMEALFNSAAPEAPEGKRLWLLERRIALWDVLRACSIAGADDASIRNPQPNDLRGLLAAADIRAVFTTGGKAFALYRKYLEHETGICACPLPSTSPANCARGLESLVEDYKKILSYLEE